MAVTHRRRSAVEPREWAALAGFLAASLVVAVLGGLATAGNVDGWYASADKPAWTPPNAVFGPVWSLLYTVMAVAAWLVWREGGWARQRVPLTLYAVQLLLNLAWTPTFFAAEQLTAALVVIAALDLVLVATVRAFRRVQPVAAALLLPYLGWCLFATSLNAGFLWAV
ncbi:MAG TPA: TspO/MBR family protein [Acidimicrobiales bacterium]|nr:TspO/MBR family protein [Acidimicrobiales bacterium]